MSDNQSPRKYLMWLFLCILWINFAVHDMASGYTSGAMQDCLGAAIFNVVFLCSYFQIEDREEPVDVG